MCSHLCSHLRSQPSREDELVVLNAEFEPGVRKYLAERRCRFAEDGVPPQHGGLGPPRPLVGSVAEVAAFNRAHAQEELALFGQERLDLYSRLSSHPLFTLCSHSVHTFGQERLDAAARAEPDGGKRYAAARP